MDLLTKPEYQPLRDENPSGRDPRLPQAIRDIKPMWVSIHSNSVTITKTGGHHQMGYSFRPSRTDTNRYDLVFSEEGSGRSGAVLHSLPAE